MRLISGKYRGKKLIVPPSLDLRPTSDKNRENLFNILLSSSILRNNGFELKECDMLDAFSGTGAVSLEALSRGINSVTLVDNNSKHLDISKKNASTMKQENIEYLLLDLSHPLPKPTKQFNFIYIDPPYLQNLINISLKNLMDSYWLRKQALIAIEHHKNEVLEIDTNILQILQQKQYKDTIFSFFKYH